MSERLLQATIDLTAYDQNLRAIKQYVGNHVHLMAVVKANAYGHGMVALAGQAERSGADYLGVVCLGELRELREAHITLPILLLNSSDPQSACDAYDLGGTVTVFDSEVLDALDMHARKNGKPARIHVKIDTGMHRAGISPDAAVSFLSHVRDRTHIFLEGIFTHFATADEADLTFFHEQLSRFSSLVSTLREKGCAPPLVHAANSAATLRLPESHFSMIRPGVITHGLSPSCAFDLPFPLRPTLSLTSQIVHIFSVPRSESVGYGRAFVAPRDTIVGLVPGGYGDGIRREPHQKEVLVCGRRVPILGRISMDQISVDLTETPHARIHDDVVFIGSQGKETITVDDVAAWWGTINYEVTTALSSRVQRRFRA